MSKLQKNAYASLEQLIEAMAAGRDELRRSEQSLRKSLTRARRTGGLVPVLLETELAESRASFDERMEAITSIRHRSRSLVFALAVEEGMSIGEVARTWGISRQLASRYVREATEG